MPKRDPKKRMAENQVVFRRHNERVKENFDEIVKIAQDSGQEYLVRDDDRPLHFYCECSDEDCRDRIVMKPSRYQQIHKNRDKFIILPGHQVDSIERTVRKTTKYYIVQKFETPPESVKELQPTPLDNTSQ